MTFEFSLNPCYRNPVGMFSTHMLRMIFKYLILLEYIIYIKQEAKTFSYICMMTFHSHSIIPSSLAPYPVMPPLFPDITLHTFMCPLFIHLLILFIQGFIFPWGWLKRYGKNYLHEHGHFANGYSTDKNIFSFPSNH